MYDKYGGRGITVCERWQGLDGFENFLADMGERPSDRHSIDRIDNDGPYTPKNCRWATGIEQQGNRRITRKLTYQGRTQTIREWATELGVPLYVISTRIQHGWPVERIITQPYAPKRKTLAA